jgi:hypothetical protein
MKPVLLETTSIVHEAYPAAWQSAISATIGLNRADEFFILHSERLMSVVDLVEQHLGASEIQNISQQLGVDPAAAQSAIQAAVPMLVGGMASTAAQPDGESTIQSLLGSHSGILGSLGSLIGAGAPVDGGGLLGQVLGRHEQTVQQGVQQASGLAPDQTKKLLMILGPIVLAALARRHAQSAAQAQLPGQTADASLGGTLRREAEAAQAKTQSSPHIGGLLGKILSHVESPRI